MADDNVFAWDRLAAPFDAAFPRSADVVSYGADMPDESDLRLIGDATGKRVVDLGCGAGHNAVALARHGAKVIAVDASANQLNIARRLAEEFETKVETHLGDMADLSFITSGSVDTVLSTQALGYVDDINRVFRQVHRILKPEAPIVLSLDHPFGLLLEHVGGVPVLQGSYFDRAPLHRRIAEIPVTVYPHTVSGLFTSLHRANFRVDAIYEPEPRVAEVRSAAWREVNSVVPSTLVIRARKQGL
jgi:SAM-dependent methyltransferase